MKPRDAESVLITGASGFIGQHLVRRLIERGDRVSCLVRATSPIDELRSSGARLIVGDVVDRACIERAMAESRADVVIHLAGLLKAVRTADFARVNAGGVESVAAACAGRAGRPLLIVVSSLAAAGPCAGEQPRMEGDSPAPVSAYGRSKLAGELAAARHAGEMEITIVRPPIVFGPGDRGVLEMFRPIARSGLHVVPGWKERRVSLIHVADLVELLLLAAGKGERLRARRSAGPGHLLRGGGPRSDVCRTWAGHGQGIGKEAGHGGARAGTPRATGRALRRLAGARAATSRLGEQRQDGTKPWPGHGCAHPPRPVRSWVGPPRPRWTERLRETAQWYRQAGWL